MSDALESQGTVLAIYDDSGSPAAFVDIGEMVSFNGFDGQASEIDVTSLDSTAKEFLMGLQDFGNFSCELNYLPDDPGQILVRAAKASREVQSFQLTFSDSSTATFSAYVLSAPISGGVDAKLDTSFTLRITGNVTFA